MRLVLQRVREAQVTVRGSTIGNVGSGLLVFLGVSKSDSTEDADYLLSKLLSLRIFEDDAGKMNRSVSETRGGILIVSQFTLYADCRRGRRPSFDAAAPPDIAEALYEYFVEKARTGPVPVQTGRFREDMQVHLTNDGPVTILLDSADR